MLGQLQRYESAIVELLLWYVLLRPYTGTDTEAETDADTDKSGMPVSLQYEQFHILFIVMLYLTTCE